MPTFTDIAGFLIGQAFGRTTLPSIDLTGKTYIVTGSNTGLGFECVKHLIRMNASKVIIACRDTTKGNTAKSRILASIPTTQPTQLEVHQLDLTSPTSIQTFTNHILTTLSRLDGFIANAGVELTSFTLSPSMPLETTLQTNVVSTYLIPLQLLPLLSSTAKAHNTQTNITIVGSLIHVFGPETQLTTIPRTQPILSTLSDPDTADMSQRYPLSKLLTHLCFSPFAELVTSCSTTTDHGPRVVANLVNPGWCASDLGRNKTMSLPQNLAFMVMGRTAEQGSRTLVHGVTVDGCHGCYLSECVVKGQSWFVGSEEGREVGRRVWGEVLSWGGIDTGTVL